LEKGSTDAFLIYTSEVTPRLSYIVNTLFFSETILTDSKEQFLAHTGIRINYSAEQITANELQIIPFGLLTQHGVHEQVIDCFEWEEMKVFFATGGNLPFDIFSASFYLLSRYEEYLPYEPDAYGRYAHTNSLAFKEGFLHLPLVNLWMENLNTILRRKFPHSPFTIHHSLFRFTPTYDIDIAYAYRHQPLWKNVLGFYRDLFLGRFEQVAERGNVYSGKQPDPFDTFEWIDRLHEKYGLQPVYFFLTVIKRGLYDKNLPARSKALQQLYRRLSAKYISGLHPSWQSGTDEWLLEKEISLLQNIIHKPVTISRNHYLRFTIPHTYRRLCAAGIRDEYSMAYGTINGFRASYTLPYRWYDLERELLTELTIHPFCFMEANSFFEQEYSAEEAGEEIQYYYDVVKKVNGEFITLFHNHFLTEQPQWIAWREMYSGFLDKNFSQYK
jgi:hypothetical protein